MTEFAKEIFTVLRTLRKYCMPLPNKFEKAILDAAWKAQKFHIYMTGQYLWYSHESFLQNFIARELADEYWVNIDLSGKKIRHEAKPLGRLPRPKKLKKRYDLVVWKKRSKRVKAVVEIKVGWQKKPVLGDLMKVREFLTTRPGWDAAGYVLYYTDKQRSTRGNEWDQNANDLKTIGTRFTRIHDHMRLHFDTQYGITHGATEFVSTHKTDDPWGFALFRC